MAIRGSHLGSAGFPWRLGQNFVLDQAPMPAEQSAERDGCGAAADAGAAVVLSGDHGAVGPVRLRASGLSAQDRELVPQHQDSVSMAMSLSRRSANHAKQSNHEQVAGIYEDEC